MENNKTEINPKEMELLLNQCSCCTTGVFGLFICPCECHLKKDEPQNDK